MVGGGNEPVLVAELTSTARFSDQYWFKIEGTIEARYLLA